jgi:hypothetical protein
MLCGAFERSQWIDKAGKFTKDAEVNAATERRIIQQRAARLAST